MPHSHWEVAASDTSVPKVILPNQPPPPPNIKATRRYQKQLLPPIHELRRNAVNILRRVEADPAQGGPALLKITERRLNLKILYRRLDRPNILQTFFWQTSDHPVVLSTIHKPDIPIFNQIASEQRVVTDKDSQGNHVSLANTLNVVERMGVGLPSNSPERLVVYPNVLGFVGWWIRHIKSPIFDVEYAEGINRENTFIRRHAIRYLEDKKNPKLQMQ